MDWRDEIKQLVGQINWIPEWGHDREMEWLDNMGDWMISKKVRETLQRHARCRIYSRK